MSPRARLRPRYEDQVFSLIELHGSRVSAYGLRSPTGKPASLVARNSRVASTSVPGERCRVSVNAPDLVALAPKVGLGRD
jgi:hypothetical protein